jgi:hypothetical protein
MARGPASILPPAWRSVDSEARTAYPAEALGWSGDLIRLLERLRVPCSPAEPLEERASDRC